MGAVYSYMLYFRKDQLAEVLMGITEMAEKHTPPVIVHFPANDLSVPLESWDSEEQPLFFDDDELGFQIALIFNPDNAILSWGHGQVIHDSPFKPFTANEHAPVSVGYIYLTIYNNLSRYAPEITLDLKDLALYHFSTTGTRMSTMFAHSTSIRKGFLELLKRFDGVCGIFNNEQEGEVFWLNGREMSSHIHDPWTSPEEITRTVIKS